jgi:bifunctional ADP-heptose synthase (sugar kinase/adenylyltransferase)
MKVLVIGDYIEDRYIFCKSERLCPEAPVPVLKPFKAIQTPGGAGLVACQLVELIGKENVIGQYGSLSRKKRYFVGSHLAMRVDRDSLGIRGDYMLTVSNLLDEKIDAVIVSDYGKGAIASSLAQLIIDKTYHLDIPVFVDAKNAWHLYDQAFAFFPNEKEYEARFYHARHIIQKLGAKGCSVDGQIIPIEKPVEVRDTTGAGDIFLAAFVAHFLKLKEMNPAISEQLMLEQAAKQANRIASESVKHTGTFIVKKNYF